MMPVPLPADWTRRVAAYPADGGPTGQAWLATVPGLLATPSTPGDWCRTGHR